VSNIKPLREVLLGFPFFIYQEFTRLNFIESIDIGKKKKYPWTKKVDLSKI
jgi:hypothetical protein